MDFETFEKIYRSRTHLYKMLNLRGFSTEQFESQTKEELNILFQHHQKKINYDIDSLDMHIKKEGGGVLVKYVLSERIKTNNLEKLVEYMYENTLTDSDTLIIITKDNVMKTRDSNKGRSAFEDYLYRNFENKKRFSQIFWLNSLLFDITEHELTPEYRILNEEEKQSVLETYHITEDKMDYVIFTDPLANFYGVKIGQVVEAKEISETNGFNIYYKLCLA